jgi:hypothetical protein
MLALGALVLVPSSSTRLPGVAAARGGGYAAATRSRPSAVWRSAVMAGGASLS